ncbi:MAG: ribokinase [Micavibrio aeruginosavorus]|uniref:Ribokinase n=1 Tax=Micavibrio aeruginosavorus TaxID=349221 RepID=A0A7T5R1V8_9BACT|nr:MAG: ribokinase [Micavibrio aeruginosavorus]
MTSPLLIQLGLPLLAEIVGGALKKIDHPAAQGAASSLGTLGEILAAGRITPEQIAEANRHAEKLAEMKLGEKQAAYQQINESLRAEVASPDAYVRRMRPTFGYLMAFTWAAQMFAVAYVIVFRTAESSLVIEAMESLGMIWGIGLSVLGVYVYQRSEEKKCGVSQNADWKDVKSQAVLPPRKPLSSLKMND